MVGLSLRLRRLDRETEELARHSAALSARVEALSRYQHIIDTETWAVQIRVLAMTTPSFDEKSWEEQQMRQSETAINETDGDVAVA